MTKQGKYGLPLELSELRAYEPHLTLTHVGDYEACVMIFPADVSDVQALLPAGLQLTPQSLTPAGQHPVLLYVGEQSRVRGVHVPGGLCPWLSPIGLCMNFLETAIAIPYVQRNGAAGAAPAHFCSVKLYLNQVLPIYLGWLCGFPKIKGQLSKTSNSYDVRMNSGLPLLNLTFSPTTPYKSPAAFPNFTAVRPMLEQPHIGQLFSVSTPLLGTFVCAAIDLKLGTAQIQPVEVQGNLTQNFSTILPSSFNLVGIDREPLGAFRLRTSWELPPPNPC